MSIFTQPAPGYLKKRTRFNTCVLLFWATLFFVVYLIYAKTAFFYAKNASSDGVRLDVDALETALGADAYSVGIVPQSDHYDYDAYGAGIPESLRIETVYRQGDRYRFLVPVDKVEMTDIGYYLSESSANLRLFRGDDDAMARQGEIKLRLSVVTIGRFKYATLIPYGSELREGQLAPGGVFSLLPRYVDHDLGLTDHVGEQISAYLLDFRDVPVESEGNELIMLIVFSVIFPLFFLYALLCLFFPRLHMNYILASRESDPDQLSAILEHEMDQEGVYRQSRQVFTEHYIIKETLHTTKVFKNHLNRH